ncbi:MAG: DUF2298 domain-containing protein [bacterium]|nr:DUF2298 domain-containing protein [bacterium]
MLFSLGVIFLPSTLLVFENFFDGGYAFSKVLSYLVLSYVVWLLGSLKILPFTREALFLLVATGIAANLYLLTRFWRRLKSATAEKVGVFIFEEVLFFSALTYWSLVRGFLPDIRGLEKFMDYGFMNSILNSTYFPPQDMWYSGFPINYYYFGHLISAVLTKLSGVSPGAAYNLMMATLFALTFSCVFSFAGNLFFSRSKSLAGAFVAGIIGALLVTLGGNFHTVYYAFKNMLSGIAPFLNYWYPDATRFIVQKFGAADNTIHEFPIYSFVVADLHGHLINLPSVLLFLSVVFHGFSRRQFSKVHLFLLAFLLGVFYMTNAWDLPVYTMVFGLSLLYVFWVKFKFHIKTLVLPALVGTAVLAGGFVVALPFHLSFENISKGVAFSDYHTPIWMFGVLWGGPLLISLLFGIFSFFKLKRKTEQEDVFVLILLAVSWVLIAVPEFIYVKDIYIESYQRANTMFKFTYQSFVMFALGSAYILTRVGEHKLRTIKKLPFKLLVLLPISAYICVQMIYPYFAIKTFYSLKTYQSLNGEYWLFKEYPGEYRALEWIRNNLHSRSVVLSAPGDSYSDYGVIQAYSGMPTVQGWFVHEWLWRGNPDEPTQRNSEVEEIYTSEDLMKTRELLNKYKIEYVVAGKLERDKYINLREEKFLNLGALVSSSEGTKIYRIN